MYTSWNKKIKYISSSHFLYISVITVIFLLFINLFSDNTVEAKSKSKSIHDYTAEYFQQNHSKQQYKKNAKENLKKRNQFSKTYENQDSTLTTMFSSEPLHYQIGDKWVDIDTTINEDKNESGFDYSVKDNAFQVKLSKNSGKPIKFTYDNASITYTALNSNNVVGKVSENTIAFEDVWTDTDVSYTVTPSGIKMFMLLKSKDSPEKFQFLLGKKNVKSKMKDDSSIDFVDKKKGEPNFRLTTD